MASASRRGGSITLLGPTRRGRGQRFIGVYEQQRALVNNFPAYVKQGDASACIWHTDEGGWLCGDADMLGENAGCFQNLGGVNVRQPNLIDSRDAWMINVGGTWLVSAHTHIVAGAADSELAAIAADELSQTKGWRTDD